MKRRSAMIYKRLCNFYWTMEQIANKGLPLFAAIENGNQELVLLLLKYEADPNIEDTSANLPLMSAIKAEQEDTIEALITAGARLNLLGDSELNALIFTSDQEYLP